MNAMFLDVLVVVAGKDYKTAADDKPKGCSAQNVKGNIQAVKLMLTSTNIKILLKSETPWREIEKLVPCSRSTILRVKKIIESEKT